MGVLALARSEGHLSETLSSLTIHRPDGTLLAALPGGGSGDWTNWIFDVFREDGRTKAARVTMEMDAHGIDLIVANKGGAKWQLGGWTTKLAPVTESLWDSATISQLTAALDSAEMQETNDPSVLCARSDDELPLTFAFNTGGGTMGLLQITGFTEKPSGVKIRYKLVQEGPEN